MHRGLCCATFWCSCVTFVRPGLPVRCTSCVPFCLDLEHDHQAHLATATPPSHGPHAHAVGHLLHVWSVAGVQGRNARDAFGMSAVVQAVVFFVLLILPGLVYGGVNWRSTSRRTHCVVRARLRWLHVPAQSPPLQLTALTPGHTRSARSAGVLAALTR